MGLFDAITGNVNTGPIRKAGSITSQGYGTAMQDVTQGTGQAIGTLTDAEKKAISALKGGTSQAARYLGQATPIWENLENMGTQGLDLYRRLLGIGGGGSFGGGGASGDIQSTLENIPGFTFERDQALQAAERPAAAGGRYNPTDLATLATGLASKDYFNYLGGVSPFFNLATGAAQGLTSNFGDLANLYAGQGRDISNILTGTGQEVAGLQSGLGSTKGQLDIGQAGAKAGTLSNIFNVKQQAGQNAMDFWGNLAAAAMGAAGRAFGGAGAPTAQIPSWQTTTSVG